MLFQSDNGRWVINDVARFSNSSILWIEIFTFVELDPYYEGILLFGGVSFLLISLILLIRDMDNPFGGNVRVDLRVMTKLEKYLADK